MFASGTMRHRAETAPLARYYLNSARLRRDFLWDRDGGQFWVAVAFSHGCQGPPGRVHGGCQFAVLDDALTVFLYGRGVSDLGDLAIGPRCGGC